MTAETIDREINETVSWHLEGSDELAIDGIDDNEFIASETIGEVIDKLIIVHIRTWHLVDALSMAEGEEALELQRKLRHCTDVKRPRLVAALNKMLRMAIGQGRLDLMHDEYVKHFEGK